VMLHHLTEGGRREENDDAGCDCLPFRSP